jgi:riboflavin kinase, archaea type
MVLAEELECLKAIALMGGCRGPVFVSSQTIGEVLKASPQTASRRLKALEAQALITRTLNPDGQHITITKRGEDELRREYIDYCRLFGREGSHYELTGIIINGLGEGKYYMSLDLYKKQFLRHLGFEPFPGTLNIRLSGPSIPTRKKMEALDWTAIKGFSADGRTFGDARCIPCRIRDIPCGIVVPGRSHYPEDIIEVIAGVGLRGALGVKENDTVNVEVAYD